MGKTYVPQGKYGVIIEQGGIVRKIRKLIYRLGFRPEPGSIFFSPTLSFHYGYMDSLKAEKR